MRTSWSNAALLCTLLHSAAFAPQPVRRAAAVVMRSSAAEALAALRVPELKDRCRTLGLPVSGTKAVLIERILEGTARIRTQ